MIKGAGWVIALRLVLKLLGIVSTIILARLLIPEDFGIIALATVIAAGLELLGAFNFDLWLIRRKTATREDYDTVWTLLVLKGIFIALLIALIAYPAAAFMNEPRLINILLVLSLGTAITGFNNVGILDFQKEMTFDREFTYFASVKLGSFFVTVSLAFWLRSYWALLAGIMVGNLLRLVLSYKLHSYRPKVCFTQWKEVYDFSKWLLSGNVLGFIYTRSHSIIIAKILGNQSVGYFTIASEIANMAATELLMPLRRVLFPAYSKMTHDPSRLRQSFIETYSLILFIGLPVVLGIGLVAEPLVWIMFGAKWFQIIPLMKILLFYGVASIGIANQGPLLLALGHARVLSNLYGLGVVFQIPLVIVFAQSYGVVGVAYVIASVHMLLFFISLFVTMRYIKLPVKQLIQHIWRAFVGLVVMSVCVNLAQEQMTMNEFDHVAVLILSAIIGVFIYIMTTTLLWFLSGKPTGTESMVFQFLRNWLDNALNKTN